MKSYLFHVSGTHCKSCKILIEDIIQEQPGVNKAELDLNKQTLSVETDLEISPAEAAENWSNILAPHKYKISLEKSAKKFDYQSFKSALPIGIIILLSFFLLQKSGLINFGLQGKLTPWSALLIGLIASLSSCLAIVGGLVLSLSAQLSKDQSSAKPLILFHFGRLISFGILGGVLGQIGNTISINYQVSTLLGIFVAIVMIVLGLNLLDIFDITKKLLPTLPTGFFSKFRKIEKGYFAPLIVGAGTFFLPCGFTQSMQLAALSSGNFFQGSMIMAMFSLGTLPVLGLISFGSLRFSHSKFAPTFFKSIGIVVIGFGLFSLLSGLIALGLIPPLFNI